MLWEQNLKSTTREIKLTFAREQNLLTVNPIERSIHHIDNVVLSYTDLRDRRKIAEHMLQNVHLSFHLLKDLQKQANERNNHATQGTVQVKSEKIANEWTTPTTDIYCINFYSIKNVFDIAAEMMMGLNMEYKDFFTTPTKTPKYHNIQIRKSNEYFENDYWPKISDCDTSILMFGDGKQYLPIYVSPENKGYM